MSEATFAFNGLIEWLRTLMVLGVEEKQISIIYRLEYIKTLLEKEGIDFSGK